MGLKIQSVFSRHMRDECAHRTGFIITEYHSIFSCVHKTNKKINPSLLLVGLILNDYCFHSRSLTFKTFRGACRQLLTQHVLALSKTAHVSSQTDSAFMILLTKIRLHCTWGFLCVQSCSLAILITKLFFFRFSYLFGDRFQEVNRCTYL